MNAKSFDNCAPIAADYGEINVIKPLQHEQLIL